MYVLRFKFAYCLAINVVFVRFDLLLAVVFPIFVLVYCYNYFQLDRNVIALNLRIYPPGSFERSVRLSSDPVQTALFRLMFDSLRIQSKLDFVLRISMNMSFCYRLIRVVQILIQAQGHEINALSSVVPKSTTHLNSAPKALRQLSLPRPIAAIFMIFSVMAIVVTHQAIENSQLRCGSYPECVAYVYRWSLTDSNLLCPCIALIDVDRAPKSYYEWENPKNATALVSHLVSSGDLRVLQLINRRLTELPRELQRCSNLQHM